MKQSKVVSCVNPHACVCYNNVKPLFTLISKQRYSIKKTTSTPWGGGSQILYVPI